MKKGKQMHANWEAFFNRYSRYCCHKAATSDFDSNTIWDKSFREGNHSSVVEQLEQKEIFSTYYIHYKQTLGKEEHPTFFLHRKSFKLYHIDYCFASADLIDKLENVEIGTYDNLITHSDHTPVTTIFKL